MLQRAEHQSGWRLGCFKKEWVFSFKCLSKNTVQTNPRTPVWMDVLSADIHVWVCTRCRISVVPLAAGAQGGPKGNTYGMRRAEWHHEVWEKLQFCTSLACRVQTTERAIVDLKCVRWVGGWVGVWKSLCIWPQDRSDRISLVPSSVKVVQPWGQCTCYLWLYVKVTKNIALSATRVKFLLKSFPCLVFLKCFFFRFHFFN